MRLLAPYLLKKAVNKVTEKMYQQQQQYQNQGNKQYQQSDFENEIKQNKIPKEKKKVGEYIDFEEIK